MENGEKKVVAASLEVPTGGGAGVFGFLESTYPDGKHPKNGDRRIRMELEDGSVEFMEFWGDEVNVFPSEVVGGTLRDAWDVWSRKDLAYIRG